MLSRDADASFWIGRYVERAEVTARMIDVQYHASLETGRTVLNWDSLLAITNTEKLFDRLGYTTDDDRGAIQFFAFDERNSGSIRRSWNSARENARGVREQISSEMWETINVSYLELREWDIDRVFTDSPHAFFERVKNASHLFQGVLNRTLSMGETRDWLDAGRFLERADQTARVLDVRYHDLLPALAQRTGDTTQSIDNAKMIQAMGSMTQKLTGPEPFGVGGPLDTHGWMATLKTVSAFEMFRKAHPTGITPANVVDFLILNPQFPASVRHALGRVEGCLTRIRGAGLDEAADEPARLLGRLCSQLNYARADEIIAAGLHEYLEDIQKRIAAVGKAIARRYLTY